MAEKHTIQNIVWFKAVAYISGNTDVVGKQKILTLEDYQLDKWIWTDADFETLGWHDSLIYAYKIDQDLYFDIDYIFKWVQPNQDSFHFGLLLAPFFSRHR